MQPISYRLSAKWQVAGMIAIDDVQQETEDDHSFKYWDPIVEEIRSSPPHESVDEGPKALVLVDRNEGGGKCIVSLSDRRKGDL